MTKACEYAIHRFCEMNGWDPNLFYEIGQFNGVSDLWVRLDLNDVNDIKFIPDEYTIGAFYTGEYFAFEIFKEGKKLCNVYPELPVPIGHA